MLYFCVFKSSIYGLDPDPNGFESPSMPGRPDMIWTSRHDAKRNSFINQAYSCSVLFTVSILFQFSDMLLYANRTTTPGLQFRVHGQLAVPDLQV